MNVSNQLMQIFTKVLTLRLKESSLLTDLYILRKRVPAFRHSVSKGAFTIKKEKQFSDDKVVPGERDMKNGDSEQDNEH